MPTYLTVCDTGAFAVSPCEATTLLVVPNGIGNVLVAHLPTPIVNPQGVFLCPSEAAAMRCIEDWKAKAKSAGFEPSKAVWPNGEWLGRAPHNLSIATPQQTLQLAT